MEDWERELSDLANRHGLTLFVSAIVVHRQGEAVGLVYDRSKYPPSQAQVISMLSSVRHSENILYERLIQSCGITISREASDVEEGEIEISEQEN